MRGAGTGACDAPAHACRARAGSQFLVVTAATGTGSREHCEDALHGDAWERGNGSGRHVQDAGCRGTWGMMAMDERSCLRPILAMSTPSITMAPPHSSCSLLVQASGFVREAVTDAQPASSGASRPSDSCANDLTRTTRAGGGASRPAGEQERRDACSTAGCTALAGRRSACREQRGRGPRLNRQLMSELLPAPVRPTTPQRDPGATFTDSPRSTSGRPSR